MAVRKIASKAAKLKSAGVAGGAARPRKIEKGTFPMQNETTQAVTDRVQAIFGDGSDRARSAIEKNTRIVEELTELTRGNVEALVTSSKVAARGVEALGQ